MVDKIRALCKLKNMSLKSLEIAAGIGNGVVARWKNSSPTVDKLLAVCAVLEVPLSEVVDDPFAAFPQLSEDEKSLLDGFCQLNEQGQEKVLSYLKFLLAEPENQRELKGGYTVQIG